MKSFPKPSCRFMAHMSEPNERRVQGGFRFKVYSLGFRVKGLGFRVEGLGLKPTTKSGRCSRLSSTLDPSRSHCKSQSPEFTGELTPKVAGESLVGTTYRGIDFGDCSSKGSAAGSHHRGGRI